MIQSNPINKMTNNQSKVETFVQGETFPPQMVEFIKTSLKGIQNHTLDKESKELFTQMVEKKILGSSFQNHFIRLIEEVESR